MNPSFKLGLRHGVPIGLGYLSVSFAFGISAVSGGLNPLQALLISMTNVTSAGQLAGLNLMVGAGNVLQISMLIQMALTQFTINLRYALMGLSLGQKLDGSMNTLRRMIFAFCNTDEIFAVASSQPGKVGHQYLFGLMIAPYVGWSLGTLLGAVASQLLPAFVTTALGIAIYGMFLAIVIPPAREQKPVRFVVIVAALCSLMCRYIPSLGRFFSEGNNSGYAVILCAVVAAGIGAWLFPIKEENE